jgi:hypothetical protein
MNMLPRFCVDLRKVEKEHKLNSNYLYRKWTRLPKKKKGAKVQIDIGSYKIVVIQRSSSNVAHPNK